MSKHKNPSVVSKAGSKLSTSKSKTVKSAAGKVLAAHKKNKH